MAYIGREPTYGAFEKQTLVGTNNVVCTAR
jgi:hypothetical protein